MEEEAITWTAALGLTAGIGLLMVVTGVFVMGIAIRAADGRLGKNRLAGIRTRATLSSDEAWQAAHQAGRELTIMAGWISVATGVVPVLVGAFLALFDLTSPDNYMVIWTALLMIGIAGLLVAAVAGALKGNRAAKAVHNPDPLA